MMEINSVANAASDAIGASSGGPDSMGKQEFLQLFMAQLSQQDPMNPMDDKAFIAQLAQFTGLEQAIETNQRLEGLQMTQTAVANSSTTDLIGKHIVADGNSVNIDQNKAGNLTFDLGGQATKVTGRIIDADGMVVRTMDLGPMQQGFQSVEWDGKNDAGSPLADGNYTFEMTATDADDKAVAVTTKLRGLVTGVSFKNGGAELLLGSLRVSPASVVEVEEVNSDSSSEVAVSTED